MHGARWPLPFNSGHVLALPVFPVNDFGPCRTVWRRDLSVHFSTMRGARPEQFPRTVTEKLLAYALGRPLDFSDRPAVRKIVRDAAAHDYRWSSLILGIVESPTFLMRASQTASN